VTDFDDVSIKCPPSASTQINVATDQWRHSQIGISSFLNISVCKRCRQTVTF